MSYALVILDSDDEDQHESTSQLDYDDTLFEDSAPIKKTLSEKPNAKKRASDELDSLLASLGSDGDQQKDDQFDFSSDATSKAADKSRYAKFLQDESPEASPSPSSSLKIQKKQSLKNPTPSKKEQPKRKDSIYSSIDDSEQIDLQQTERENSTEILVQESHRLLASDTGKKRRSLKNPISHNKEKDSIDDVTTLTRKREDSLDRLFAPSSSKRKDSLDDLLYPSTSKARRTPSLDLSSESKMKRQDSFEFDGDFMGRNKDTPSRKKQSEPIDLLSDDDSDHKETTTKLRLDTYNDDKPRKFKPSSRLKVTNKPRKSSIDMLIDDDDMPVPSSPKEMPTRPHPKPSYEIMLNDSDSREESREESSQESSPTLEPKRLVQKRKRPSSELSNQNTSSRKSRDTKSIASVTLDDDDDDNDSLSITRSSVFDNDDDDDNDSLSITRNSVFDNDDNDEGGLDSDSFFNNLLLSKNKKDSFVNKRSPLESLASSSKSTNIYMDLDDDNDDDDEPIITDRKGKKRADAIRPLRKRQDSFDDVLGDDILTPKEKRQLQSEKKKQEAQRKREERERLKQEKKLEKEKQALFEKANKIKSNRNDILKEMIMDIHPSFLITKPGQIIQQVMESKEAEVCPLSDECLESISWRRKCTAEWDADSQSFHPLQKTKLVEEPVVLVFFPVNRFIQHIMDDTLDRTINKVKSSHRNKQIMVMIEGLETYYKKKKSLESRQFQQTVRQRINENDTENTASNGRKKKKSASIYEIGPQKEDVEKVLVDLQMLNDIMLLPTKSDDDSASWIESLTIDLALGRYKSKNMNNTYRVTRTGKGASDTFFKMLQEVYLCTPAVANSVMSTYPSAQSLYQEYKRTSRGSELLADLEVQRSAVQVRDRTINRVMSKKIHSIFTNTDPESVIF